jgi:hypothetical protein
MFNIQILKNNIDFYANTINLNSYSSLSMHGKLYSRSFGQLAYPDFFFVKNIFVKKS